MAIDKSRCIYCSAVDDLTVDHVPPRSVFPQPRTSDLITVPACRACNMSYGLDDEYFRLAIALVAESVNPAARELWQQKVVRGTLRHSPTLKAALLRTLQRAEFQTTGGLYLGTAPTFTITGARIDRVACRIVTALHWRHYGAVPNPDVVMRVAMTPDPRHPGLVERLVPDVLGGRPLHSIGGKVFQYAFDRADDIPAAGAWLLVFYSAIAFLVTLTPPSCVQEKSDRPTR